MRDDVEIASLNNYDKQHPFYSKTIFFLIILTTCMKRVTCSKNMVFSCYARNKKKEESEKYINAYGI
jgi:hypothetical protein